MPNSILPHACHGTVYMPAVHAYLLCMAACDKQVGRAQAPAVGGTFQSLHFAQITLGSQASP